MKSDRDIDSSGNNSGNNSSSSISISGNTNNSNSSDNINNIADSSHNTTTNTNTNTNITTNNNTTTIDINTTILINEHDASDSNGDIKKGNKALAYKEISPNKRYVCFEELLSKTANSIQSSFKAFDTKNGIEVVWHTINLNALNESEQMGVTKCANVVKKIQNRYIIEYLSCWFKAETRSLNVITTQLDTLKDFFGKVLTLRWRIVKKWCRQILRALDHLHSSEPSIIHRHLTCSHLYIDGGLSTVNVGDMWLAAVVSEDSNSPIGLSDKMIKDLAKSSHSSAFIAPELFESKPLTTSTDIYSFGMCVLEMITQEEAYKECQSSHTKIRAKATSGQPPLSLSRITQPLARKFIEVCLVPQQERPSASSLLNHPFLAESEDEDNEVSLGPIIADKFGEAGDKEVGDEEEVKVDVSSSDNPSADNHHLGKELADFGHGENVHVDKGVHDGRREDKEISVDNSSDTNTNDEHQIQLKIIIPANLTTEGEVDKEVEFTFDKLKDNYQTVASEMIEELKLLMQVDALAQQLSLLVSQKTESSATSTTLDIPTDNKNTTPTTTSPHNAAVVSTDSDITITEINSVDRSVSSNPTLTIPTDNTDTNIESEINDVDNSPKVHHELYTLVDINDSNSHDNSAHSEVLVAEIIEAVINDDHATPDIDSAPKEIIASITNDTDTKESMVSGIDANIDTKNNNSNYKNDTDMSDTTITTTITTASIIESGSNDSRDIDDKDTFSILNFSVFDMSEITGSLVEAGLSVADELELQKEMEKLGKESRAAKRAFEQRIQKHKSIQEKCDDDFLKLQDEYDNKMIELQRKEQSAAKKRDDEVVKLNQDFEKKIIAYKIQMKLKNKK